jgi:hypothetical protein
MTERRTTALYRLKTPIKRVGEVLSALVEGLDVSVAGQVFGHSEGTIRTWLTRAELHSGKVHRHFFHDLILKHLQLDELRTTLRRKSRTVWLWVALDVETKVVLVLQLGLRTQAIAHRVVHELCSYLAPGCVPLFSSDGLDHYFYVLTAHFGQWGQQIGEGVPALIRRTWSTAQEQGELSLHLEWWRGYYHFVRPHQNLRVELARPIKRGGQWLPQRYRSRTPAMAAVVAFLARKNRDQPFHHLCHPSRLRHLFLEKPGRSSGYSRPDGARFNHDDGKIHQSGQSGPT